MNMAVVDSRHSILGGSQMASDERFTDEERRMLSGFFTNLDGPVFALINMPEVVKGALFARYSRSPKSLRRLFLDEFLSDTDEDLVASRSMDDPLLDHKRAERLYQTVFHDYGDDSVAQLGGVHLACEGASNLLTKVLEWGRLASYLEQSTRYMAYDDKVGGRYRYHIPTELTGGLADQYTAFCDRTFETYADIVAQLVSRFEERFPKPDGDPTWVWRSTIRAKAFDLTRGLLPAATRSNVGIYGTGQAYEMALMRMRAHPLGEVRDYGELMLTELRKVIPSFLTRVDLPDRGLRWSEYLSDVRTRLDGATSGLGTTPETGPSVTLTDFDEDAENEVIAAALYPYSEKTDEELLGLVSNMGEAERRRIFDDLVGDRANRRHKPGRAME
ncbi:MAG: thymidylate synthase, partial [Acidimicrobiia bacterium]|nr:thymidylate synthase [Acidimicrobiia bacterium]